MSHLAAFVLRLAAAAALDSYDTTRRATALAAAYHMRLAADAYEAAS